MLEAHEERQATSTLCWWSLGGVLLPGLLAIVCFPGFVTQDGPAHSYSAEVLADAIRPVLGRGEVYEVRWQPLPNWAGHLSLSGLILAGLTPRGADRVLMGVTLVALGAATLALRIEVAGRRGGLAAALLAGLLAMNVMWLLGFYSFLLGGALFAATLGLWWRQRERPGPAGAAAVALLLVAGYFAHVVSLGFAVLGLGILTVATPGTSMLLKRRVLWTGVSLIPLVPLVMVYRGIMREAGGLEPSWPILVDPLSPRCWWSQLGWVDPISLGSKLALPFAEGTRKWHLALAPLPWLLAGLAGLGIASWQSGRGVGRGTGDTEWFRQRRGFALLGATLLLLGLLGPDSLGPEHGNYLAQRAVLLGLLSLVPVFEVSRGRRLARVSLGALLVAVIVQACFVCDYAARSDRNVRALLDTRPMLGEGQRLGVLIAELRQPFRANPLRHADCLLGLGNRNVVWGNYEMAHYYFPVQVRRGVRHPSPLAFEKVALKSAPREEKERATEWAELLASYHDTLDRVVIWGQGEGLQEAAEEYFERVGGVSKATVYARPQEGGASRRVAKRREGIPPETK